jgi:uncharacterized protein
MIPRAYEPLDRFLDPNKVLIVYGPRCSGKTTLLQSFLQQTTLKTRLVSGDHIRVQHLLSSQDFRQILAFIEGYQLLAIDEAQEIPNVGMGLKILVDHVPGIYVIATGSSSFELSGQVGEPLTGRKRTLTLYPISQSELLEQNNRFELRENIDHYLIFGSYPEVVLAKNLRDKIEVITEIANAYLLKDILALEQIRSSRTLADMLKLVAFQVGNEVSYNELASQLGIDVKTVQRYMDLLEKAFVIFRLGAFSRNLRREVTRTSKFYFYDNGIRNALIAQFNPLDQRNDIGALWENFLFMERMKHRTYTGIYANIYFWRTYNQQEIDLIEEREGHLFGYEAKWSPKKRLLPPSLWKKTYPESEYQVITPQNYFEFIS